MKLVLASKSPRRIELLKGLGWNFDVIPSTASEEIKGNPTPSEVVSLLSSRKACNVAADCFSSWIIGADTVVVIDGRILGKPKDEKDAFAMLSSLEGHTHRVLTGVTVINPSGQILTRCSCSYVTMRFLTKEEILSYIACGESMDKAGAYAIQGKGSLLISNIEGDYFNIVGLPLSLLSSMLVEMKFPLTHQFCGVGNDE